MYYIILFFYIFTIIIQKKINNKNIQIIKQIGILK
jgi:hypothetical protein